MREILSQSALDLRKKTSDRFSFKEDLQNIKNNLLYGHKNNSLNCGLMLGNMNTGAYRGSVTNWDAVWGILSDQTIEDCTTYANSTEFDSKLIPSHTTVNYVRGNPTTDVVDGTFTNSAAAHCFAYRDLTGAIISDSAWILRFKLVTTTITAPTGGLSHSIYIGFSSATTNFASASDFAGLGLWDPGPSESPNTPKYYVEARDGVSASIATGTTSQVFTAAWATGTKYIEIIRLSSTSLKITIYSDSSYTTVTETQTMTIPSTIVNLRYFKIGVFDNANIPGWVISVDDIQFRDGATTP